MSHSQSYSKFWMLAVLAVLALPMFAVSPIIKWNTFQGSAGNDFAWATTVDRWGNVYIAGESDANWGDPLHGFSGKNNGFVAKFASNGTLIWHTFIGSGDNSIDAIAVDGGDNIYVAGDTANNWGSPIRSYSGSSDGFVAKLDNNGQVLWHTFLGSAANDYNKSIAVDTAGNVFVAGNGSGSWGAPIHPYTNAEDSFVAKLDTYGHLIWNTFLGATGMDSAEAITVDASGMVYIAGISTNSWGDPIQPLIAPGNSFVAKLDNSGHLLWNTFQGDSAPVITFSMALDMGGNIYITGFCTATWGTPLNPFTGLIDSCVVKLDSHGQLLWNTFVGSADNLLNQSYGLAIDSSSNVYIVGFDIIMPVNSPVTPANIALTPSPSFYQAYAVKLNTNGHKDWQLEFGSVIINTAPQTMPQVNRLAPRAQRWLDSFQLTGNMANINYDINGGGLNMATSIALDKSGHVYVAGASNGSWGDPLNSYQNGLDAFLTQIVQSYTVNFTAGSNGTLTGETSQVVAQNESTSPVSAVPNQGYHLVNWTLANGDIISTANPLILTNVHNDMTVTANFANNPPQVAITSPANNAAVYGIIQIHADASDDSAVTKVEFYIDGVLVGTSTTGPYEFTWNSLSYANGSHTIKAVAYDDGGLSAESMVSVNISNILITLQAERLTEQSWLIKRQYGQIHFSVSNASAAATRYVISRRTGSGAYQAIGTVPASALQNNAYTYNDTFLASNQTYTYLVTAQDAAGNIMGVSSEVTI